MEQLFAVAGFVIFAVVTPGPNNFIVLTAAARGGLMAATPAIVGVIAGSLALLALVWVGAGAAFGVEPRLRIVLAAVGALYLAWLGGSLIWRTGRREIGDQRPEAGGLPSTALGLVGFQFLNPKAWVLILTVTAASPDDSAGFAVLAALFIVIPGLSLTLWACAGSAVAGWLARPVPRRWFDRAMGGLLIGSAVLLFS